MRLRFTKMHGAGNDFVVLDGTRGDLKLTPAQVRRLGTAVRRRRRPDPGRRAARTPGVDFAYRIFNASGGEVEHCGNGARCFVRYVHAHGLTDKRLVRVETVNNLLELRLEDDGGSRWT
jgi:diaminopimelate epimerase